MKNLIILFLILNAAIFSQQIDIRGKIIDSQTSIPLPNANLYIKSHSDIGTISKQNGKFSLSGKFSVEDTLVASYVGYVEQNIPLKSETDLNNILIKLVVKIIPSQTVLVEGSVGKTGITPITFSKIKRKEIQQDYTVLFLQLQACHRTCRNRSSL